VARFGEHCQRIPAAGVVAIRRNTCAVAGRDFPPLRGRGGHARLAEASVRVAMEGLAQLILGAFQYPPAHLRQIAAGAIDIEIQHRHGGLVGRALAARTPLGRTLQRLCDAIRAAGFEYRTLEVERVAMAIDFSGPQTFVCDTARTGGFLFACGAHLPLRRAPSMPLEILDRALVLLGGGSSVEGTEISTAFGLRINFPGVQTIFARTEFADHDSVLLIHHRCEESHYLAVITVGLR
jgi:hypothetical protein